MLALQAWLTFTHEPFVDEWQALQLAVQAPDLGSLIYNMSYEGHPPLWHIVLRLLAVVVGPANALAVAAALFGLGTQLLILLRSPFAPWMRLALALCEPIFFEFGVLSRSYAMGVFLIFACMALWNERRWFYLPLALLPATEFLFGVISVGLLIMRHGDRALGKLRTWWPGIGLWMACSLLAAWSVIPAPDFVPVYHPSSGVLSGTISWAILLGSVAVPLQWSGGMHWNVFPQTPLWIVLWLPLFLAIWQQTRGQWADRVAVGLYLLVTWAFFALFYALALRHMFLLSALLVALLWRQAGRGLPIVPLFRIWTFVGAACGLATAATNVAVPFDTARIAARYMMEHDLQDETWIALPFMHGQGISAMTGITFEGYGLDCRNDFIRWNVEKAPTTPAAIDAWLDDEGQLAGRFHVLSDRALPARPNVDLVEHVPGGYAGKGYYLYAVNPDATYRRAFRPRCVEGMNRLEPVGW